MTKNKPAGHLPSRFIVMKEEKMKNCYLQV